MSHEAPRPRPAASRTTDIARAALALLTACSPAAPRVQKAPAPTAIADAGLADMTPAKGADVPSMDALATTEMPLMRVSMRISDVSEPTEIIADADTCFRAVVAASTPVKAWFTDATHAPRGEIAEASSANDPTTLVPPRGPVCAKKGEKLHLVVHASTAGTIARAVVFASL